MLKTRVFVSILLVSFLMGLNSPAYAHEDCDIGFRMTVGPDVVINFDGSIEKRFISLGRTGVQRAQLDWIAQEFGEHPIHLDMKVTNLDQGELESHMTLTWAGYNWRHFILEVRDFGWAKVNINVEHAGRTCSYELYALRWEETNVLK